MTLDERLLKAHEKDNRTTLVALYIEAADQAADIDAQCFYLTHAYVFALETGDARRSELHQRLAKYGRV